jgi:hypothetical protein
MAATTLLASNPTDEDIDGAMSKSAAVEPT